MTYIPKSKLNIKETFGKEFRTKSDYKEYIGKYMQLSNGKLIAGIDPLNPGPVLEPYSNGQDLFGKTSDVKTHRRLNPIISNKLSNHKDISFNKNVPTEEDYERGYFTRYFVKRVNEPFGYKEINKKIYDSIVQKRSAYDKNLYKVGKIKWVIKGNARKMNGITLVKNRTRFPNLSFIYPQLNEFVRDEVVNNQFASPGELYYKDEPFREYVGPYHIHPTKGPMVGATHSNTPHERLIFAKDRDMDDESKEKYIMESRAREEAYRKRVLKYNDKIEGTANYILSGESPEWYQSTLDKATEAGRSIEEQAIREATWVVDNSGDYDDVVSSNMSNISNMGGSTFRGGGMSSGGGTSGGGTSGGGGGGY
tara:strand:- start:291 stop:1388 length:1098 start_codon:yes stop_codon:yes gene_type:complete